MTTVDTTKCCPIWKHKCYGDRCQAWGEYNQCKIIDAMISGAYSPSVVPYSYDNQSPIWKNPFTC